MWRITGTLAECTSRISAIHCGPCGTYQTPGNLRLIESDGGWAAWAA
jgi:hypothetical protein